jgi:hypothetical protein
MNVESLFFASMLRKAYDYRGQPLPVASVRNRIHVYVGGEAEDGEGASMKAKRARSRGAILTCFLASRVLWHEPQREFLATSHGIDWIIGVRRIDQQELIQASCGVFTPLYDLFGDEELIPPTIKKRRPLTVLA